MSELVTVILAAGKGTRMKSALPKVLHRIGGKAMVEHVLDAADFAGTRQSIIVVGFGAEKVQDELTGRADFVLQEKQLGTGHAVMQAEELLKDFTGTVMVLCGDTPLLQGELLAKLYAEHRAVNAAATVLTAVMPDPSGYGRVVRDASGGVRKIVEQKDAAVDELAVREINTGIYCFESQLLFEALKQINCSNAQGEYYLTDVIGILVQKQAKIWAVVAENYNDTMGINSRLQLAQAEKIIRQRKNVSLMEQGVTIMDPDSTFIDESVKVAPDTVIYPFTWLEGRTVIDSGCIIGPNTRIQNTKIGRDVTLHFVYAHDCEIGDSVTVGPYVHLRPNTKLDSGVKIGNFVEVKNSNIGENSKIPHLSYIGDTDMGTRVNIGSGTITVNYDGKHKYRTTIADDAFIGCNSNLVAPVMIGQGSYIAAGSTITKDVPPAALGVGRARQSNIEEWVNKRK